MKYRHRLGIFVSAFLALITVILVWPALVGRLPGHRLPPTTVIEPSSMSSPQTIQIRLGEQPTDFLARFADRVKVNSQPAGLDFLSIDWRHPPYGTLRLDQPHASFTVTHVLGVQTFRRAASGSQQGITRFAIYGAVNEGGDIAHDAARIHIQELLDRILSAGWHQMVDPDEPRLAGAERLKRTLASSNLNGLDARYAVPLADWMRIEDGTPWSFVRDDAVLLVTFRRDAAKMDSALPGAYFLSLTWMTINEHFREMVDSDDRDRWQALVPALLVQARQRRLDKEDELRKAGWKIDTTYVDPAIPTAR